MEVKAKLKYLKVSPRKTRLVAALVRGLKIEEAYAQLGSINKKVAAEMKKLLDSVVANALNNFELDKENLFIKTLQVDDGPTLHRWIPRARGRATPIRKRTSHVSIILGEIKDSGVKEAKKTVVEAPVKLGSKPKQDDGVKIGDKSGEKKGEGVVVKEEKSEKGKKVAEPRSEGHGKHTKIEGGKGQKGFVDKIFRRKSG